MFRKKPGFEFIKPREIPEEELQKIWLKYHGKNKPFPVVHALIVDAKQFKKFSKWALASKYVKDTSIEEYGFKVNPKWDVAYCLPEDNGFLIIVIDTYHDDLEPVLRHELDHIYNEDYVRWL